MLRLSNTENRAQLRRIYHVSDNVWLTDKMTQAINVHRSIRPEIEKRCALHQIGGYEAEVYGRYTLYPYIPLVTNAK